MTAPIGSNRMLNLYVGHPHPHQLLGSEFGFNRLAHLIPAQTSVIVNFEFNAGHMVDPVDGFKPSVNVRHVDAAPEWPAGPLHTTSDRVKESFQLFLDGFDYLALTGTGEEFNRNSKPEIQVARPYDMYFGCQ